MGARCAFEKTSGTSHCLGQDLERGKLDNPPDPHSMATWLLPSCGSGATVEGALVLTLSGCPFYVFSLLLHILPIQAVFNLFSVTQQVCPFIAELMD